MKQIICCALVILTLASCKKEIEVDLNNTPAQTVIEGVITNASFAEVRISNTVNFSSPNDSAPIRNADVKVADDFGNLYILPETSPGIYTNSQLVGVPGHTYQLLVKFLGKEFKAISTMPQVVYMDTLLLERMVGPNGTTWIVKPQYRDPAGLGNSYRFVETINQTRYPIDWVLDDRVLDDGIKSIPLLQTDSLIRTNDVVQVEMQCLDRNIFRYLSLLADLNSNVAAPANPPGNISGGALGYFSAHTSQKRSLKVK
jgi:hypothetical protein